jgi:NAD(P)-dependent dehydrogenase (short-subunit alcohol dehydrogenase family)
LLLDRRADCPGQSRRIGAAPVACDIRDPGAVASRRRPRRRLLGGPADGSSIQPVCTGSRPLLDLTPDEWDDVLAVNLRGSFLAGRAWPPR